ncbi:MAG: LysR family transcriptional regulator [Polaromonas sp.]|uniref:LysR family transcriptional regulator n=1 Tax=Polaromonas sp. TaxID=1869339 RepID=UPI002730707A|nr:LysR family transcriptional regulator [Polaromonas sp.]MDP2257889.1 LysR family transcriptional regulator [Polaromonas sp.]
MSAINLARFDLVSIRLAVACAQTGSLTAAAREGHLALAASSRRIRELEDALGEALFERHARGLTPTAAGRVFVKHGLTLLQTMDSLGGELADLRQGIARHIRLAASTAAIIQFLPPLMARYAVLEPQLRVDLEEQTSETVVTSLREGRADLGVFVEGPDTAGLTTQLFKQDQLVLVLPAGHRLAASQTPLPFADTLDEDWISLTAGAAMLQQQQQAALAANKPFRLRMQVRSFDAVCHLVASGLGIAVLPKAAALPTLRAMKLKSRPLLDAWARRRLLVATTAGEQDAGINALVDFLVQPSQNAKAGRTMQ